MIHFAICASVLSHNQYTHIYTPFIGLFFPFIDLCLTDAYMNDTINQINKSMFAHIIKKKPAHFSTMMFDVRILNNSAMFNVWFLCIEFIQVKIYWMTGFHSLHTKNFIQSIYKIFLETLIKNEGITYEYYILFFYFE